ncbi:hypothetical protein BGZ60DRAFT_283353 [Tricladium varicosporioides]|nr:hypothetical protein BGZ60DRAFT_283353 [Hymenoscyphus varicosporioides]
MSNTRYQFLGRSSEDSDRESAVHDALLLRGDPDDTASPTCSGEIGLVMLLRFGSSACAVASFISLLASRHEEFIGAAIFAILLFIFNLCLIDTPTCKIITSFFPYKIIIEPRNPRGQISLNPLSTKPKKRSQIPVLSICLGLVLNFSLFLSVIIPHNLMEYWQQQDMKAAWIAGVTAGYICCILQLLVVVTQILMKDLAVCVKFYVRKPKPSDESSFRPIMTTTNTFENDGQQKDGVKEPALPAGENVV